MPRTKTGKGAGGAGSIRKITTTKNGKTYTYWQARYTEGFDPGTGKQIQRSITGKTQKEVAQKLKQVTLDIDNGVYHAPCKLTLTQWLEIWSKTYLGGVKPRTAHIYKSDIRLHILPALGAVRLEALNAPMIQAFYNAMGEPSEQNPEGLSAKTVKNVHGVLHKALQQAVLIGYLRYNPADACVLPRIERKKIKPFDDAQITAFLTAIQGSRFETLFILTLFTGMREGEVLGLTWDCIDFATGIISVEKQMQLHQDKVSKGYELVSPKNGRSRTIAAAQTVLTRLQQQRRWQMQQKLLLGSDWQNSEGLVFTNEFGTHLTKSTVYREYKRIVAAIGCPNARFHDLRHPYVKHTTKIFSLRLMDFQAQAYPDARRKTRGACQLHRGGQSRSPVRPLCNRKQLSCLLPQSKMSWILYAISMRLSGYTSTRSISSSASSVVSVSASKIALDASLRLSCRACSSCFCFACANTAA